MSQRDLKIVLSVVTARAHPNAKVCISAKITYWKFESGIGSCCGGQGKVYHVVGMMEKLLTGVLVRSRIGI